VYKDEQKIIEAFKTGRGLGWKDRNNFLFEDTARLFRPNYFAHLTSQWMSSPEGVESKLKHREGKDYLCWVWPRHFDIPNGDGVTSTQISSGLTIAGRLLSGQGKRWKEKA
jgi:hypothetical protein